MGLLLLPFLTPYLTKEDFGVWGTLTAYTLLFSATRDLGMIAPMLNTFFQHQTRWKWVWRQIHTFLFLFGLIYTAIQLSVLAFIMPSEAETNSLLILSLIGLQSIFFDVPNLIGARFLQINEKPLLLSLISMTSGFIAIGAQIYYVVYLKEGYMGWFFATFYSTMASALFYLIIIYRNKLMPIYALRFRLLKARIIVSLPMLPHNYSSYLLNASDRVVMNVYKVSNQNIGLYNVAYMWGNYVDILGNAIGMAVGPFYLKLFAEKKAEAELKIYHLTYFLQILFLVGPFILSIWTKELFGVFIKNQELQTAYGISIIIVMGYSYRPLYWNIVSRLQFNNFTKDFWKISLIAGAINLILNLILIPFFGYEVAAITTFISLIYMGFSGFYLKSFKKFDKNNYAQFVWLILIIIFTILAYFLKDVNIWIKVGVSVIVVSSSFLYIKKKHYNYLK